MAISKQDEFLQMWEAKLAEKSNNTKSLSLKRYKEIIREIKITREKNGKKSSAEYRILKTYELLDVRGQEFLINKKEYLKNDAAIRYYVPNELIYEKINDIHLKHSHGGIQKTMKHVTEKYCNLTEDAVKLYIQLCLECETRRRKTTSKTAIVKPIRS